MKREIKKRERQAASVHLDRAQLGRALREITTERLGEYHCESDPRRTTGKPLEMLSNDFQNLNERFAVLKHSLHNRSVENSY